MARNIKNARGSETTRGSPDRGESIRPWTSGITAENPTCHRCSWVRKGGEWALKFVNRGCSKHGKLA